MLLFKKTGHLNKVQKELVLKKIKILLKKKWWLPLIQQKLW